jgi:spore coat protein U-like protein
VNIPAFYFSNQKTINQQRRSIMKFNFNRQTIPAMTMLFGLCTIPVAQAFTNTGSMDVSATIESSCSVSASPMAFGIVLPGVSKDTTAVVTAKCTAGTAYTLDLGDGLYHITTGGTGGQYRRQMASAANRLPYVIYIDSTRATEIAATAVALNNLLTTTVGNAVDQPVTIYGRVIGAESTAMPAGDYTDTVTVTISF